MVVHPVTVVLQKAGGKASHKKMFGIVYEYYIYIYIWLYIKYQFQFVTQKYSIFCVPLSKISTRVQSTDVRMTEGDNRKMKYISSNH